MNGFQPGSWLFRSGSRNVVLFLALLFLASTALGSLTSRQPYSAYAAPVLLSQGKPATSSCNENGSLTPNLAVDGNSATRWSSCWSDPQWIQVDLGAGYSISRVVLNWEAAYGRAYQIQVADSAGGPWRTIFSTSSGDGGIDDLSVSGSGRYLRMYGTARATPYGYSLWEFQVYGESNTVGCGTTNVAQGRPATASSNENASLTPNLAVDGNSGTRWSSAWSDPQWIQVDLGASLSLCRVVLSWEAAYGRAYEIQAADSAGGPWRTLYTTSSGDGGVDDLLLSGSGRYVRMYGTARATPYGYSLWELQVYSGSLPPPTDTPPDPTPIDDGSFWGYTSAIPPAQNVLMFKFLNRTNGRFEDSEIFWSFNGQTYSIAERPYFDMPANSAGRMYFYLGSPDSPYSDFIEFTVGPDMFNGNTTRVDWFGIKLAMRLHAHDGYDKAVGEDLATFQEDRAVTFQRFIDEVPAEFKHLAQIQAPYRIPAPGKMGESEFLAGGRYANYFDSYAASVGVSASTFDIMACAGSLAGDPAMCSALNRHVAHLPQSEWSNASRFYQAAPANYYAKFWHDHSIDGLAYGFPYDDYADRSSFIAHGDPQYLLVAIGW